MTTSPTGRCFPRTRTGTRAAIVGATLVLRLPYVAHHNLYSDELVPGVVALHALAEARPILECYGRPGNAGELVQAYLALPFFALFGADERWLGLATVAITVAMVLLFHHLAARGFGEPVALLAALSVALPPPELWRATVWVNTHNVGLALGLALIAWSDSLAASGAPGVVSAALLGAVLPVCGWLNPMALVIAAPALPLALGRRAVAPRRLAAGTAALALGALATRALWGPTLAFVIGPAPGAGADGRIAASAARLGATFTAGLARGLGFASELPRTGGALDAGMAGLLAVSYLAFAARALRRGDVAPEASRGFRRAALAVPPLVGLAIAASSRDGSKYWLYALPFLFLAWGSVLARAPRALAWPAAALFLAGSAYTCARTIDAVHDDVVTRLVAHLRARGIDRVYTDDALKWPLTFVSREAIVAAGELPSRYPDHEREVFASPHAAVVLSDVSPVRGAVEAALSRAGATHDTSEVGDFVVWSAFDRDVRCALRDVYRANAALFPPELCLESP